MNLITSLPKEITMSDKKSYNYLALRGAPVDDMEYVETFGLSPDSAYSNKINEDMLQYNYDKAVENLTKLQRSRRMLSVTLESYLLRTVCLNKKAPTSFLNWILVGVFFLF